MITNFDYLKKDSKFSRFADVAISAEKIILMDPEASILNSRRAMEFAIKWMYSVDSELEMPYQDKDCLMEKIKRNFIYLISAGILNFSE